MPPQDLLADADIAQRLRVSKSCIRGQRFKRRHGLPHWLEVDPVELGRCVRYLAADVSEWLQTVSKKGETPRE